MKNILKTISFSLLAIAFVSQLNAQDSTQKNDNIIIIKKGPTKEKFDITIDGNSVTVNGKPVDNFKNDNLDVIKQNGSNNLSYNLDLSNDDLMPMAPNAPQVRLFRNDMMNKIKSNTAFLGVMSEGTEKGAKITEVTKASAAEKAGLKEGDIITKINDSNINGPEDLYKIVGGYNPDDKIKITYLRDGKQLTTQATLEKSDQVKVYSWNAPGQQFDLKDFAPKNFSFNWDSKPRIGLQAQDTEDGNGVKVTDIDDDDSPAAKAGLKQNDIITEVNGAKVTSVDDLVTNMKDMKKGDTVKITYKRNNETKTVDVKVPKDLKTIDL